jgi:hypothetical protein
LPKSHSPPLSHSSHLQPPTSVEQPPRGAPGPHLQDTHLPYLTTPLSHADVDQITPLETEASTARQRLQPRQWMARHTAPVAQPSAADHTACRPPRSPCSNYAAHAPWTPRACAAFPTVHARFSHPQHTSLYGIETTSPRHHCPARSSPHLPWP